MKSLQDCIKLPHQVTFLVPSTVNVNQEDNQKAVLVLDYVKRTCAIHYGGFTSYSQADGGWMSDVVNLVEEKVTPVSVFVPDLSAKTQDHFLGIADYIKTEMTQESVMVIVDGKGYLW